MKKYLLLLLGTFVLNGCDNFVATKVYNVKVDVTGTSPRTKIVVAHTSPYTETVYKNIVLPFIMCPFPLQTGDTILVIARNLDTGSMKASISLDDVLLIERETSSDSVIVLLGRIP